MYEFLSTFLAASSILAHQYQDMDYATHANLVSHLFLAEKQHQMLSKNADSAPAKKAHAAEISTRKPKDTRPSHRQNSHKS